MELDDDKFIRLIETIAESTVKLDNITVNQKSLDERMVKLEALREQDIKQNEKIEHILNSLKAGNAHFQELDLRVGALESKDGMEARETLKKIMWLFVAAFVGGIIGNIGGIVHWLGGGA